MMTGASLRPQGNINRKEKLNAIALNLLRSQLTIHFKTSCFVGKKLQQQQQKPLAQCGVTSSIIPALKRLTEVKFEKNLIT